MLLHCSHSDLQSDSVSTWLHSSHLCHKSNCMLIGSHQRVSGEALNVSIGGNLLTQVSSVWYLGVSMLSWNVLPL